VFTLMALSRQASNYIALAKTENASQASLRQA
jgi:hypothetical protein